VRNYESVFIFDPDLKEDDLKQITDKITNIIDSSGQLKKIEVWGKRKLMYPIKKKNEGIYNLFLFAGESNLPGELKHFTVINEKVLRSMVISKDITAFDNIVSNNKIEKPVAAEKKVTQENNNENVAQVVEEAQVQEAEIKIQADEIKIQEEEKNIQEDEKEIQEAETIITETPNEE
jgi:small subunit ribosomal protein S6